MLTEQALRDALQRLPMIAFDGIAYRAIDLQYQQQNIAIVA